MLGRRVGPLARAGIFRAIDFSVRIQCQRQVIAPKPVCPARARAAGCCCACAHGRSSSSQASVGSAARWIASGHGRAQGMGGEGYTRRAASTAHFHSPSMAAARVSSFAAADRPPPEKDRCLAIPQAQPVQQPLAQRRQSAVGMRFASLCALPVYLHTALQVCTTALIIF